ncbi:hypothetical protein BURK1_01695 [Burkholderiales bacterium]|nr:hypothetical protein BURK1_01695 [Burkholderiales bacterium]
MPIEIFFLLAALVVVIGLVVWRRDVKSGRVRRPGRGAADATTIGRMSGPGANATPRKRADR